MLIFGKVFVEHQILYRFQSFGFSRETYSTDAFVVFVSEEISWSLLSSHFLTVKVPFVFILFIFFDSDIDIAKLPNNFRPWTVAVVGEDSAWEQKKLEARKMH